MEKGELAPVDEAALRKRLPKRQRPFRSRVQGRYRYRDAKGRFISKAEYDALRKQFSADEEALLDEMRQALRGKVVGVGAEFELTATTGGGTPRRNTA